MRRLFVGRRLIRAGRARIGQSHQLRLLVLCYFDQGIHFSRQTIDFRILLSHVRFELCDAGFEFRNAGGGRLRFRLTGHVLPNASRQAQQSKRSFLRLSPEDVIFARGKVIRIR